MIHFFSYMGTANGETDLDRIPSGINSYFNSSRTLTAPTVNRWNSVKDDGTPITGLTYNSTSTFANIIDKGFPVGVYCSQSNVITPGYYGGINGAHMMSGIGYSFGSAGNYITCYTTCVDDGKVNFPVTSLGLKDHAWYLLYW